MKLGGGTSEASLRASTRNSLAIANENQLRSIAFPAIGAGIGGFPIARCARIMIDEVRVHLSRPTTIERVEFVLFDSAAMSAFELELSR